MRIAGTAAERDGGEPTNKRVRLSRRHGLRRRRDRRGRTRGETEAPKIQKDGPAALRNPDVLSVQREITVICHHRLELAHHVEEPEPRSKR